LSAGLDNVDKVVGLDARGFIFGSLVAYRLNKPFVMVRKK
jgi:adenine phosphoribosyltransferase